MMILFHYPLCPISRATRLILHELRLGHELSEVKPWAMSRDFLNMNPGGYLPVLKMEGVTLCGFYPISEYLFELMPKDTPHIKLWPDNREERAEARRITDWFSRKFDYEITQYMLEEKVYKPHYAPRSAPDLTAIRTSRSNLRYHLSYVGFLSETRKWLGGDHMTFADFAAAAQISTIDYLSEITWTEFPEAKNWYARIKSRPAFRTLLNDMVPGLQPAAHYANLDF